MKIQIDTQNAQSLKKRFSAFANIYSSRVPYKFILAYWEDFTIL